MDGVLNVNKPSGPTSHDVIARIRRVTRIKRVGHAGTLDPLASGVLVVAIGNATRILEYMSDWPKSYRATAILGAETDTEDITGEIIREYDCSHATKHSLESMLPRFVGKIMQIPPMVSALKHQGRRLYDLAREGKTIEREPRPVEIFSLRLLDFQPGDKPSFAIDVSCSGGTYIRTVCADIGKAMGCGAYMSSLVRTGVGPLHVEDALDPDEIERAVADCRLQDILHPMDEVLSDMPIAVVSHRDEPLVSNGVLLSLRRFDVKGERPALGGPVRIHSQAGRLIGIGMLRESPEGELEVKPHKVFSSADESSD